MDLTFSGLDPAKEYSFATSSSRADNTYTNRHTRFTLSGVDGAVNASTAGVNVINNLSVWFNTGDNQAAGYVARWTGIRPGVDGSFTVRAEAQDPTAEYRAYSFDVFRLEEEANPASCYPLTLTPGVNGATPTVTASALCGAGQYAASEVIQLSGAVPASGYQVGGWTGTVNNAGTASANTAIMPAGAHTMGVNYVVIPSAALDFGTGNAYVTFGDPAALDLAQFTIETWFKREGTGVEVTTGSGGITNAIPLVTKGRGESDGSNVDMNYFLGIRASDNVLVADFEDMASGLNHPVIGKTPVVNNTWYHAAVTYNGNKWQIFLNGNLETELVVGQTPRSDSLQHAALGTALTSTGIQGDAPVGHFDGVLDEVRIWNYARSQAQIQTDINAQITAAQSGLVARWGLNEGSGTAVNGSAGTAVNGTVTNTGASWVSPGAPFNITINNPPNQPTLVAPANGAAGIGTSPALTVNVTDPETDNMTVSFYGRIAGSGGGGEDFTVVMLPDTQFYSETYPATFNAQTQWIVNNAAALNVAFVTHVGDVVNVYNDTTQWTRANTAMSILENPITGYPQGIPYGIAPGNHDNNYGADTTFFNNTFGASRFSGKSYYGGYYGSNNNNSYQLFSAGGMDFIVIHLEYDDTPDSAVLTWANGLLTTYNTRRAIVSSHNVLGTGNPATFSSQGSAIYNALKGNANFFLMVGGHTSGEGRRSDTLNGNTVHTLLADYQTRANGGSGWLRIMEFSPANDEIRIKTYSPTLSTYETDADSQFTLAYDMGGSSYQLINSTTGVPPDRVPGVTWPGLAHSTEYEWYATVSDGLHTPVTGPTWRFTTTAPPACYTLTLSHTGNGSNPAASPAKSASCASNGQYVSGEVINLSGASPDAGWQISGWTGTNNNGSTASTNTLTMPAGAQTASVTYSQICYTLTLGHTGNGTNPTSFADQFNRLFGGAVRGWSGNQSQRSRGGFRKSDRELVWNIQQQQHRRHQLADHAYLRSCRGGQLYRPGHIFSNGEWRRERNRNDIREFVR